MGAIHAGIALILLTPLVVSPVVFYPYSVGKAVWARALIAVVFALWAVLALRARGGGHARARSSRCSARLLPWGSSRHG